jgi:glycosyltransferase involved in cell wall biosynthesis
VALPRISPSLQAPKAAVTVSIIIPVYRGERYIAATLDSVLRQTFADFEVIIVDDGSPDRSIAICKAFDDPRIRYLQQDNAGPAAARNAGIRAARGTYVAFIDADDLWVPEKLERHVAHLDASPEVGVSFSLSAFIDERGIPLGSYQMVGRNPRRPVDCFVRYPLGNGSNAVVRAAVLRGQRQPGAAGAQASPCLFDEELRQAEDFELLNRIAATTGWRIESIPWPLTLYRINAAGLTADTAAQRRYHMLAIDKIAAYAPDLVRRHRAASISNLHWYLARSLVLQGHVRQASRAVARAVRARPGNIHLYTALVAGAVALMWLLPAAWHRRCVRQGQHIYGSCQRWLMARQQARAPAVAWARDAASRDSAQRLRVDSAGLHN